MQLSNEDGKTGFDDNNKGDDFDSKGGCDKIIIKKDDIDKMCLKNVNNSYFEIRFNEINRSLSSEKAVNNINGDIEIKDKSNEINEKNKINSSVLTTKTLKRQSNKQYLHLSRVNDKKQNIKLIKSQSQNKSKSKRKIKINSIIHESQGEDEDYNSNKNEMESNRSIKTNRNLNSTIKTKQLNFYPNLSVITSRKNKSMDISIETVMNTITNLINDNSKVILPSINRQTQLEKSFTSSIIINKKKKKKSANIQANISQNEQNISINSLYQSKTYQKQKFHKLQKEIKEKEEKAIKQECTFQPKINQNINEIYCCSNYDFTLRQKLWLDKAKERLDNKKDIIYFIEQTNCTFQPKISGEVPQYQEQYIKGTKKYYKRISRMNKLNEEKNKKKNPNYVERYNNIYKKKERKVCNDNLNLNEFKLALKSLHTELLNDEEEDS